MVNVPPFERSKASKELVTAPVMAVPFVAVADVLGVIVTVEVFTLGLRAAPSFETPTPVTLYSHPVL